MDPIYLDYHATTPVDPRVLDAMLPFLRANFGNPSSTTHEFGRAAALAIEQARARVAELIGARPREIVFTSGATESIQLAVHGSVSARLPGLRRRGEAAHAITVSTEHAAGLASVLGLRARGVEVTVVDVDEDGRVDPDAIGAALRPETILVSVMAANNEIGVLNPLEAIGALTSARGVLLHVDAVQAVGRVPFDVAHVHADLVSLSAHKIYGPKGAGALYIRQTGRPVRLKALVPGGGQETGLRGGTLNVPSIVGFGVAAELMSSEGLGRAVVEGALRDQLLEALRKRLGEVRIHGSLEHRLPNNLNIGLPGVDTADMLTTMREVALSAGSACASGGSTGSHVLEALGFEGVAARTALRFGLGRWTTAEEVERAAEVVANYALRAGYTPR